MYSVQQSLLGLGVIISSTGIMDQVSTKCNMQLPQWSYSPCVNSKVQVVSL